MKRAPLHLRRHLHRHLALVRRQARRDAARLLGAHDRAWRDAQADERRLYDVRNALHVRRRRPT